MKYCSRLTGIFEESQITTFIERTNVGVQFIEPVNKKLPNNPGRINPTPTKYKKI
jgi:hypothetical protein